MESTLLAIADRPIYAQGADVLRLWACWDLKSRFPRPEDLFPNPIDIKKPVADSDKTFLSLMDTATVKAASSQLRSIVVSVASQRLRLSDKIKPKDLKLIEEIFLPSDQILARAALFTASVFPTVSQMASDPQKRIDLYPHVRALLRKILNRLPTATKDLMAAVTSVPFQRFLFSCKIEPSLSLNGRKPIFTVDPDIDGEVEAFLGLVDTATLDYGAEHKTFNSLFDVNPEPRPLDWFFNEYKDLNQQKNMYLLQLSHNPAVSKHSEELGRLTTMKFSSRAAFNKFIGLFHMYSGSESLAFAYHLLKPSEPGLSAICGLELLLSFSDFAALGFSTVEAAVESMLTTLVSEIHPESTTVLRILARLNVNFAAEVSKVLSDSNISIQWGKSSTKGLLKRVTSVFSGFQAETAVLAQKRSSWIASPLVALGVATSVAAVVATFVSWRRSQTGS